MSRAFGGPGKYIQRRGEIDRLGEHVAPLGKRPLILIDKVLHDRLKPRIEAGLGDEVTATFERFGGECSWAEIERITTAAKAAEADVVVAVGGGKTIDTAKTTAINVGARIAVVPTIASTDAPCSAVAVVYDDHGVFVESLRLPRNPDVVVVDPEVIVQAPVRFFVAGIGDALSTWFEARSNIESRTDNYVAGGFPRTLAGIAIAERCQSVLMRDAVKAKAAVEQGLCTTAVENIIEANTLLSGLGFENCGCSGAHGIHDALTILDETHGFLHGEKVAFGTLCLLMLEDRDPDEIAAMVRFCRSMGLPTTLADLKITEDVTAKIGHISEAAVNDPNSVVHAVPVTLTPTLLRDSILALDAFARSLD